ncbi:recombinase family protein [Carboxylicivirga marina]|uniref:Recombinase family protein n=1 Tax=Carboxylicivirga marina TaxID=2800988 RepID=A0ABS1HNU0_9BACT|nr:recombinase family protein [Carboxylicivirga marina]MBK3518908.1 recombinase family protein [Carboxylicivirga marina]
MKATYIRVSTAKQNTEVQELKQVGKVYIDRIMGITPFEERPEGSKLLKDIVIGRITHVYVVRLDRLGRNALDILKTIQLFKEYECQLTIQSMGLNLFESGKVNKTFMLMAGLYAQIAEQQREEIKEKTQEGIELAKKRGVYRGRKQGTAETPEQVLTKYKDVANCLRSGMSLAKTVETTGKTKPTVIKVKKLLSLDS